MELEKTEFFLLPESERNILFLISARLLMSCASSYVYETKRLQSYLTARSIPLRQRERLFYLPAGKI